MISIIGSVNIDLIATTLSAYRPQDSNPAKVALSIGGVAMNYAQNMRLLGEDLQFFTAFSDDLLGQIAMQECIQKGIHIDYASTVSHSHANVFMGIHNNEGDLEAAACDAEGAEKYVNKDYLAQHINTINASLLVMADTNISSETLAYLLDNCRAPLMIDGVSMAKTERLIEALKMAKHPHIHTLKLNKQEFAVFSERTKQMNLSAVVDTLLVSLGEEGVTIYQFHDSPTTQTYPALSAPHIVSTLGAGDAFLSGWAYAYLHQYPLDKSVLFAQQLAVHTLSVAEAVNTNPIL